MAWIETHQSLLTHRKVLRLARLLELDRFATVGRLVAMWCWALDNAPDGMIEDADADALAEVMGWPGEPSALVHALFTAGFLDEGANSMHHLHDWDDYAGKLIDRRKANTDRQRAWRDRHKNDTVTEHNDYVTVTSPSRNGATVPNSTVPNTTSSQKRDISSSFVAADATSAADADAGGERKKLSSLPMESQPVILATYLRDRILAHKPDARDAKLAQGARRLQDWAKIIDHLLRTDKRQPDQIRRVIDFATADPFWSGNILSPNALRTQFDKLEIKLRTPSLPLAANGHRPHLRSVPEPPAYDTYVPPPKFD